MSWLGSPISKAKDRKMSYKKSAIFGTGSGIPVAYALNAIWARSVI
jgi:hypothetical protein